MNFPQINARDRHAVRRRARRGWADSMATKKEKVIHAAVVGIADRWGLTPKECSALLRALKPARRKDTQPYDPKRVSLLLDIFEWMEAISENLGASAKLLRAAPAGELPYLDKILSGRLDQLSEVHRDLAKHVFFGCSPV